MSLIRLLARITAVEALRNKTVAEDRVFDSAVTPIDQRMTEEKRPFLTVTTDDHASDISGKNLLHSEASADIVFEIAVGSKVKVAVEPGVDAAEYIDIPHTDPATELMLDVFEDQVLMALLSSEQWAEYFRKLMPSFTNFASRRGAQAENGLRFAARQIVLSGELLGRPERGAADTHVLMTSLLPALEADEALAPAAKLIRQQLSDTTATDWDKLLEVTGWAGNTPLAMGVALEDGVVQGDPVSEVTVQSTDKGEEYVITPEPEE